MLQFCIYSNFMMPRLKNKGFTALITILLLSGYITTLFIAISVRTFISQENLKSVLIDFQHNYNNESCGEMQQLSNHLVCEDI